MKLSNIFQITAALSNIYSARLRSALAVLGILVGTASVVAMVSGGELATRQALMQFRALGTDLLSISISFASPAKNVAIASVVEFDLNAAMGLANISDDILKIAPYVNLYDNIMFAGQKLEGGVVGVTEDFFSITKINLLKGRKIYSLDKSAPFCVIGNGIYAQLKKLTLNPLDQQIRIGDDIFTIVGIDKPWGENAFLYFNADSTIFIPILKSKMINADSQINNILLKLKPQTEIDKLTATINKYFAKNYPNSRVYIRSAKQFIDGMAKQKEIFTLFLAFIGGIALLVGGIGIMNIMLVSVAERRREIGVRMAIGAKRKDIYNLFLFESLALSLSGGVAGILVGIFISFIIAFVRGWEFTFFFLPPIIGFSVSVLTGIFFGSYPAYKASKLDPIETLRSE